jgi:UDP-N-acetylmuramate--alanine ligase
MNLHFMGIGGSGMSAIAEVCLYLGYSVTGCDKKADSPYIQDLKTKTKIFFDHDSDHINNQTDLLIVNPAILLKNSDHPEIQKARDLNIPIINWQEFLGEFIIPQLKKEFDIQLIVVSGSSGKSTTTALLSQALSKAGAGNISTAGANVPEWGGKNFFISNNPKYYVLEGDEFNKNFLNYNPDILLINNITFAHAEFYKNYEHTLKAFEKLSQKPSIRKILLNFFDQGCNDLFSLFDDILKEKTEFFGQKINEFNYKTNLPGNYNRQNILAVEAVLSFLSQTGELAGIPSQLLQEVLLDFKGLEMRFEKVGFIGGKEVFVDYANFPLGIKSLYNMVKEEYSTDEVVFLYRPILSQKVKVLFDEFLDTFKHFDFTTYILPIDPIRENQKVIESSDLVQKLNTSGKDNYYFVESYQEFIDKIKQMPYKALVAYGGGSDIYKIKEYLHKK